MPKRLQTNRATANIAWIQKTDAEDFSRLLRVGHDRNSEQRH
jgi:hypothetical protein